MTYLHNADKGRKCPSVVRFPPRRQSAVFIIPERLGGFYTVFGSRGWLFPNLGDAHMGDFRVNAGRFNISLRSASL